MLQSRNTVLQLGLYIFFYIYLSIIFFLECMDLEEKETRTHFL